MNQLHTVALTKDRPPGSALAVDVGGHRVALFNIQGKCYAIDDTCSHSGGPLSEGDVDGTEVECPWHGACFDLTDGSVLNPPAEEPVKSYPVHVDGDEIKIEMP